MHACTEARKQDAIQAYRDGIAAAAAPEAYSNLAALLSEVGSKAEAVDVAQARMHARMHARTHACTHARTHARTIEALSVGGVGGLLGKYLCVRACSCAHVRTCARAHVRACMFAWLRAGVRACLRAWVRVRGCMGAWVHGCMGAWVRVCLRVCVVAYVHAYARTRVCVRAQSAVSYRAVRDMRTCMHDACGRVHERHN